MANLNEFGNIWNTFKELDIRPIAEEAERPVVLAFVGAEGTGKSTLIAALRQDKHAREKVISPTIEANLATASQIGPADLIVLVLDATCENFATEIELFREWRRIGQNVVVFYNKMDLAADANKIAATMTPWVGARIAFGFATDPESLQKEFVLRVIEALAPQQLSLARHYPLFRLAIARGIVSDTAFANAAYSIGTGFAEIVPLLDVPFNVADLVVLTKNQALMVYKLGLALGLSTRWQDHMAEFGGVIGAGFLWRQIARQLIGLIPVWGIVPKVAVAYAGTYAVGEAILRWYQTGRGISQQGMKEIYAEALARGKRIAQDLAARAPKPTLPRIKWPALRRPSFPALPRPKARVKFVCPHCGKKNPSDAKYCAYCAADLIR